MLRADGDRGAPRHKDKCKEISKMKAELEKLQKDYGQKAAETKRRASKSG